MIDASALDADLLPALALDEADLWAELLAPAGVGPPLDVDVAAAAASPGTSESVSDVDRQSFASASGGEESAGERQAAAASPQSLLSMLWDQDDAAKKTAGGKKRKQQQQGPPSPLLWTDPDAALSQVDAPNADTMEARRAKNREFMRRARERQRDDFKRMKATVARLENQYAELSRAAPAMEDALVAVAPSPGNSQADKAKDLFQRRYVEMLALTKRLRAENLYLKAGLQDHAAWKQHLHRILDSTIDPSSPVRHAFPLSPGSPSSSPVSSPSARGTVATLSRPLVLNLDVLDPAEADALYHFSMLDEAAISRAIVDNAFETQSILESTMTAVRAKDPRVRRHDVLGWDVIQRVRGSYMEYVHTKRFTDLDVEDAGQKMWMNDMQTDSFRQVLAELRRIEVLQRVNPNTYVLGRDIKPFDGNTVFRSVFMRFRTQVSREIPNGSLPPLKATGFVIGSHSVNRDWSCASPPAQYQSYRPGDSGERPADLRDGEALEWAEFTYVTEFVTVEDPTTGEKYHQIQWIGRSDFKSPVEAVRNAPDSLTVCLRTEMLFFRPVVRLAAIGAAEAR